MLCGLETHNSVLPTQNSNETKIKLTVKLSFNQTGLSYLASFYLYTSRFQNPLSLPVQYRITDPFGLVVPQRLTALIYLFYHET